MDRFALDRMATAINAIMIWTTHPCHLLSSPTHHTPHSQRRLSLSTSHADHPYPLPSSSKTNHVRLPRHRSILEQMRSTNSYCSQCKLHHLISETRDGAHEPRLCPRPAIFDARTISTTMVKTCQNVGPGIAHDPDVNYDSFNRDQGWEMLRLEEPNKWIWVDETVYTASLCWTTLEGARASLETHGIVSVTQSSSVNSSIANKYSVVSKMSQVENWKLVDKLEPQGLSRHNTMRKQVDTARKTSQAMVQISLEAGAASSRQDIDVIPPSRNELPFIFECTDRFIFRDCTRWTASTFHGLIVSSASRYFICPACTMVVDDPIWKHGETRAMIPDCSTCGSKCGRRITARHRDPGMEIEIYRGSGARPG